MSKRVWHDEAFAFFPTTDRYNDAEHPLSAAFPKDNDEAVHQHIKGVMKRNGKTIEDVEAALGVRQRAAYNKIKQPSRLNKWEVVSLLGKLGCGTNIDVLRSDDVFLDPKRSAGHIGARPRVDATLYEDEYELVNLWRKLNDSQRQIVVSTVREFIKDNESLDAAGGYFIEKITSNHGEFM